MLIKETFMNETRGYQFGDSGWYEAYTDHKGKLFRSLRQEYGRCTSRIYRDVPMGDGTFHTVPVGWHFQKKVQYQDCNETYLRGVWVEYKEGKES